MRPCVYAASKSSHDYECKNKMVSIVSAEEYALRIHIRTAIEQRTK